MIRYTFINLIGNVDFLNFLLNNKLIPSEISTNLDNVVWNKVDSKMNDEIMSNKRQISYGGFNVVFAIGNQTGDINDKVFRTTIEPVHTNEIDAEEIKIDNFDFEKINNDGKNELTGLLHRPKRKMRQNAVITYIFSLRSLKLCFK